jgi:hypothetical protein
MWLRSMAMPYIPNAVLESARTWVERPQGSLWFSHVPVGRKVVVSGETFYFEQHPDLVLPTSNIPEYIKNGLIRARDGQ